MGGSFTISIKWDEASLKTLQSELEKRQELTPFQSVVAANGSKLQRKAMAKAPIDTGTLMRSITMDTKDDGLTATVTPEAEYAAYVEYGTRFMAAQPYLRPAFETMRPRFIADLRKLME